MYQMFLYNAKYGDIKHTISDIILSKKMHIIWKTYNDQCYLKSVLKMY